MEASRFKYSKNFHFLTSDSAVRAVDNWGEIARSAFNSVPPDAQVATLLDNIVEIVCTPISNSLRSKSTDGTTIGILNIVFLSKELQSLFCNVADTLRTHTLCPESDVLICLELQALMARRFVPLNWVEKFRTPELGGEITTRGFSHTV